MNESVQKTSAPSINVVIHGRHAVLSNRFKEHVRTKLIRIDRFALEVARVDVELTHEANPRQSDRAFEIELTSDGIGPFIRAKAHAADKYTAFDLAHERFVEQLRRMHERAKSIEHRRPNPGTQLIELPTTVPADNQVSTEPDVVLESGPLQVAIAHPSVPNISVEQAVEKMELSGLKFLIFIDSASGIQSVLYPRHGYDYGLMQLGKAS
ncbi:MAG: ribosome-associated translation inhibitor RaiA [Actinomycetes bacterium]